MAHLLRFVAEFLRAFTRPDLFLRLFLSFVSIKIMQLTPRGERIMAIVGIVAMINFLSFFIIALCIGGDAVNGQVENGSYFLGSRGKLIEVDRGVYLYSYIHVVSVFVTHASVFVAPLALRMTGQFRR